MFPLGWVPFHSHHVHEDSTPRWRETNLATKESGSQSGPKPLPLVYLDASLSSFTQKPQGQKKSKKVHETKQTTQLT